MSIGENIKKARKKVGLTQKELGKRLGIKQQTVAMYENNATNIKLSTLCRIANALDVQVSTLIDGTDMNFERMLDKQYEQDGYLWNLAVDCFFAAYALTDNEIERFDLNEDDKSVYISGDDGNEYIFSLSEFDNFFLDILEYFKFKLTQKIQNDKKD